MRQTVLFVLIAWAAGLALSFGAAHAGCHSYAETLHLLGEFADISYARCVDYEEPYLVVADWQGAFRVIDASDPARLSLAGAMQLASDPRGLDVAGSLACVSLGSRQVQLFDISNPQQIELRGVLPMPSVPYGLAVDGNRAFVTATQYAGEEGVYVVDIADPADPRIITSVDVGTMPRGIVIDGGIAYVLAFYEIVILDIAVPESPAIVGRLSMPGESWYAVARGDFLYVVCESTEGKRSWGNGLYVIDRTDPTNLRIVGSYAPEEDAPCSGLALWGDAAISSAGSLGLGFYDIADPMRPSLIGFVGVQDYARGLIVRDDTLFAAGDRVVSYSLSEQLTPPPFALVPQSDGCSVIAPFGSHAAMTRSPGAELVIVDLTNPSEPEVVATEPLDSEWAYVIAATENDSRRPFVYVSGTENPDTTLIFDLSDPRHPRRCGTLSMPYHPSDLDVEGDRLYAAAGAAGVRIYDIVDPAAPRLLGVIDFDYSVVGVTAVGTTLYCARRVLYYETLFIYDVSDPANPILLGLTQIPEVPFDVVVDGNMAYIADGPGGLLILDVSNPASPRQVSRFRGLEEARDLFLHRGIAYVADSNTNSGIHLVDVSDSEAPYAVGYFRSNRPNAVERIGNHALVANWVYPAEVMPLRCEPAGLSDERVAAGAPSLSIHGNPVRGDLEIDLWMPAACRARVALFDPLGRTIRVLHDGTLEAGPRGLRWDGRDRFGRRCAAGVYCVALESEGGRVGRLIVYLPER